MCVLQWAGSIYEQGSVTLVYRLALACGSEQLVTMYSGTEGFYGLGKAAQSLCGRIHIFSFWNVLENFFTPALHLSLHGHMHSCKCAPVKIKQ